jgi:hypothetical protein
MWAGDDLSVYPLVVSLKVIFDGEQNLYRFGSVMKFASSQGCRPTQTLTPEVPDYILNCPEEYDLPLLFHTFENYN